MRSPSPTGLRVTAFLAALVATGGAAAASGRELPAVPDPSGPPAAESELRDIVDRYELDRAVLGRRFPVELSAERTKRVSRFHEDWKLRVGALPFEPLGVEGRIDHVLLRNELDSELRLQGRATARQSGALALLPFAPALLALNDARLRMEPLDAARAAAALDALKEEVETVRKGAETEGAKIDRLAAFRAQEVVAELSEVLKSWHGFYAGYDPLFTWWAAAPHDRLSRALGKLREVLREKVLGIRPGDDEPIVGTPIGRDGLVEDLQSELISYTPEELLKLADREFAWCEAEMKKAARELGHGDDWRAALEKVKALHAEPGKQPALILALAREAEEYLEKHDLITVPSLAREVWRMEMMSPERQKVNPFFTGGEVISVSFPTDTMDHADKLMSLRGNNAHFARATVFHELIPGHHLQTFMNARYNPHRRTFRTPFWTEGWALYWEMLLWDRGFARTPENKIGMLFWRMHRAARILFSLRFHLGSMTPQECIDFLVERVGHERANATAEVRRSFNGSYSPLYQAAYMVGGLQFRALHRELVASGRMTERQFHDAVITGGPMPLEMVRARLLKQRLARDHRASWRFAEDLPAGR